jgi:hypothetical protein
MDLLEHIRGLETELLRAMRTDDIPVLDRLLADDLLFTDHAGKVITKEWDLAAHRSGDMTISSLTPSEQVIRIYSSAVIVASVRLAIAGTYRNEEFTGDIRYTRVWMERNGAWQVVAGHSSVVT